MTPIAPHIAAFLREHLAHQRGASQHTCDSRPPDIARFDGWNGGFRAPGVRTNTCPVFETARA